MTALIGDTAEVFGWLRTLPLSPSNANWVRKMEEAAQRQAGNLSARQVGVLERVIESAGQSDCDLRAVFRPPEYRSRVRYSERPQRKPKRRARKCQAADQTATGLQVFTDGACSPNPGRGGWGVVFVQDGKPIAEHSGGCATDTTNNRMEMRAIIEALKHIPAGTPAIIYSDSRLCVQQASGRWKARVNQDLVQTARQLASQTGARIKWIKGHDGNKWNERADELASKGIPR